MIPNKDFLILALDFDSSESSVDFLRKVPEIKFIKIGMELFYSEGPSIFSKFRDINPEIKIFLDLKINDIPKTIEKTIRKLSQFKPDYITLFTGKSGIEAARNGKADNSLKLLNVTVLTSEENSGNDVINRAQLSYDAGADGVICSGLETVQIRNTIKNDSFIIVNPGIRLIKGGDDQVRTVTPREAFDNGATNIVVGRPITQAPNPALAFEQIIKSFN